MIEKAGGLYFRFFCYLYVLFSFVLIQKKKYKKELLDRCETRCDPFSMLPAAKLAKKQKKCDICYFKAVQEPIGFYTALKCGS